MIGHGTLTINNCPCFMGGVGTMTILGNSRVEMYGAGIFTAIASEMPRGRVALQPLASVGGSVGYAFSEQNLPMLITGGDDNYVPPNPSYGLSYLAAISSWGYAPVKDGEGASSIRALLSIGGDYNYALGSGYLQPLRAFGEHEPQEMFVFSYGFLYGMIFPALEQIIVLSSTGTLLSSFVGTRVLVQEMLSTLLGSSAFSLLAEFRIDLINSILGQSLISAHCGGGPNVDSTSRVWVVNMDTFANSQYDDYGFQSFVTRDGISYGVADDGIYELTGDTDSGMPITSMIDFGRSSLGTSQRKRVENVYLGVASGKKMLLKVDADGVSYIYEARSSSTDIKNNRVDIGKGLTGNYWNFTLLNQNGCDFDLETIAFEPIKLSGKI